MDLHVLACLLLCMFRISVHSSDEIRNKLPDCSENSLYQYPKGIILVSTLDGRLTALNADAGNMLMWNVNTGPGPLLSSSIHKLELTNNGQWVRMIPSLSGGLYKFNGISLESLPVKADHLIQSSSFLLNDGLIISGGRQNSVYGIDLDTGETLYECNIDGCIYHKNVSNNMIVIQRHTQTVRAIDMHTGSERWNFSVGQHNLQLPFSANCHARQTLNTDFDVNAVIPEGIVYATSKMQPNNILWKQKFDSPIVAIWKFENGEIKNVELFHENVWSSSTESQQVAPVLYIGMHKKQLYIQETSPHNIRKSAKLIYNDAMETLQVPWNPVPVTSTSLAFTRLEENDSNEDDGATTALSVLYGSEYVNGNGYYLFRENSKSGNEVRQCNAGKINVTDNSSNIFDDGENDTPVHVIIVSLWYWWKEVLIISFVTAIIVNMILTQPVLQMVQLGPKEIVFIEKPVPAESNRVTTKVVSHDRNNSEVVEYKSRYLMDFETVQCLGRGGFGVVFEAKNKIDECNYAIKRIQLPNSQESRERVLREVKALAKLDHPHIVRYFNSWLECPPSKWLDNHDSLHCALSSQSGSMYSNDDHELNSTEPDDSFIEKSVPISRTEKNNHLLSHSSSFLKHSLIDSNDSFVVFEDSESCVDKVIPYDRNDNVSVNVEDTVSLKISEGDSFSQLNSIESPESRGRTSRKCSESEFNSHKALPPPTKMYLYIQMQLCHKKSLRDWLCLNTLKRDKQKMLQMFEQILQAVEYIHGEGLIHRDLKPSNIFFSIHGQIKVGDFGLVTNMAKNPGNTVTENKIFSHKDEKHTAQVGTQLYMSPEQMEGLPYDYKVDIYSLGLILFELLFPFCTQMERCDTLQGLRKNQYPEIFTQQFEDEHRVLNLMLSHDPKRRPSAFDIRTSLPYLNSLGYKKQEPISAHLDFDSPFSHSKNYFLDSPKEV